MPVALDGGSDGNGNNQTVSGEGNTQIYNNGGIVNNNGPAGSASHAPPHATAPATSPGGNMAGGVDGTDISLGCPAPPGADNASSLWIHVTKWCASTAVRGQAQLKLKLWMINTGAHTLPADVSHFFLVVQSMIPSRWTPPEIGAAATQHPRRVRYEGVEVWAVPANPERAFDSVPGLAGVGTFATHWGLSQLPPRARFEPTDNRHGDLVFYIPVSRGKAATLAGVIGVAYLEHGKVVVVCPPAKWGPCQPEDSF